MWGAPYFLFDVPTLALTLVHALANIHSCLVLFVLSIF